MPLSHLAGLGQRTSPYLKYCIRWRNHQSIKFGRRTAHMSVHATNMGRLPRTRNEHKTGQSTVCYRMSNEHKPNVERIYVSSITLGIISKWCPKLYFVILKTDKIQSTYVTEWVLNTNMTNGPMNGWSARITNVYRTQWTSNERITNKLGTCTG